MKFDDKVKNVLKEAHDSAVKAGLSSYGAPHVMMALMQTKDFSSAYTGDYKKLKELVKYSMTIYRYKAEKDLMGYDLVQICNTIMPNIYKKLEKVVVSKDIILAHLFWALCADSDAFHLEDFMEANGVDKIEVFVNLASYCDVDSDTIDIDKIENYAYNIDMNTGKTTCAIREKYEEEDEEEEEKKESSAPFPFPFGMPTPGASEKSGSALKKYCTDLIESAKKYDKPFIGREDVIHRTMQVLCKAEKSNPVHVGEPGVGKSAVTKGLAKMILEDKVPDILKKSKLYELDLTALVAGTCYRGDFEKRIKQVLTELSKLDKPILFVDEIHMLIGAGAGGSGNMDAANILKPYLTEGKIKFIGATTYKEYSQYIEKDPALMRRFQKIEIVEPSVEDSIEILNGLKEHYEKYHDVTYTPEAIRASVELTAQYIHDRYLPDKAIDMIDEAGAYVNVNPEHEKTVTTEDVEEILCSICKIPKKSLKKEEMKSIAVLEDTLNSKVFGQKQAVKMVSDAIKLSKSGLADENKPVGAFLFVGPSGVGKTELAKQLAETLSLKLLRFDMSEYAEQHSVAKLIGSPAGYVGYDDGGLLTDAIMKTPHSVLLLDEIEKAHPEIFKTFLQMFDYGMITDSKGHKVDCRNLIIIMTSNAGVASASKPALGFGRSEEVNVSAVEDAVNRLFPVEFRNRLSGIVTFNGLNEEMSILVVQKELDNLRIRLEKSGIHATFSSACIKKLAKDGMSYEYGARNLQRVINEKIKKMFVDGIISGTAYKNCEVDVKDDNFYIKEVITEDATVEEAEKASA